MFRCVVCSSKSPTAEKLAVAYFRSFSCTTTLNSPIKDDIERWRDNKFPNNNEYDKRAPSVAHLNAEDRALCARDGILGTRAIRWLDGGSAFEVLDTKEEMFIASCRTIPPEVLIAQLQEENNNNKRINGSLFFTQLLLPVEQGNTHLCTFLQRNPCCLPFLISLCGNTMSNIPPRNKLIILDRFIKSLRKNEIPLSIEAMTSLLNTWMENEFQFDPARFIHVTTKKLKLTPDLCFFTACLWGSTQKGNDPCGTALEPILTEMRTYNIEPDLQQLKLMRIFCAEFAGDTVKSDQLIAQFKDEHGEDEMATKGSLVMAQDDASDKFLIGSKYLLENDVNITALSAAARGAALRPNVSRLRAIICQTIGREKYTFTVSRKTPAGIERENRAYTLLRYPVVFDIIWQLARKSSSSYGRENIALIQELLRNSVRRAGYFKTSVREVDRHVAAGYFYSALELLDATQFVRTALFQQKKIKIITDQLYRYCTALAKHQVGMSTVTELANRINVVFGERVRFWEIYWHTIMRFTDINADRKYEIFTSLVDKIDPERKRAHIAFPLLVGCQDMTARCKLLYLCTSLKYDFSSCDTPFMCQTFISPLIEKIGAHSPNCLDQLSSLLGTYGMEARAVWKLLSNYLAYRNYERCFNGGNEPTLCLPVDEALITSWLRVTHASLFGKGSTPRQRRHNLEAEEATFDPSQLTAANLHKLVLERGEMELAHAFLAQTGGRIPPGTDLNAVLVPLLDVHLRHMEWPKLEMLIKWIAKEPSCNGVVPAKLVTNAHLLQILHRKHLDLPFEQNITGLVEYLFELRRLFPLSEAISLREVPRSHLSRSMIAAQELFEDVFGTPYLCAKDSRRSAYEKRVEQGIELLSALVRLNMIRLMDNESLTPLITKRMVHGLGWEFAVETLFSQLSVYSPNGLLSLLIYGYERQLEDAQIQYVIQRCQKFMSRLRVKMFQIGALMLVQRHEEAAQLFAQDPKLDAWDCFRLLKVANTIGRRSSRLTWGFTDFLIHFARNSIAHTNLCENQNALHKFITEWIHIADVRKTESIVVNEFLSLLTKHGVEVSEANKTRIRRMMDEQQALVRQWLLDEESALLRQEDVDFERNKSRNQQQGGLGKPRIPLPDYEIERTLGNLMKEEHFSADQQDEEDPFLEKRLRKSDSLYR